MIYPTGYVECWTEPDTTVKVQMSIDGVVQYVMVRLPRSQAHSTETALRTRLGPPHSACDYGEDSRAIAWRRDRYDVLLIAFGSDSVAYLEYTLLTDDTTATPGYAGCTRDIIH